MATMPTMKEMANSITLTVRIKRDQEWEWRLKIGALLLRLAAWIMWMNIDIEVVD